MLRPATLCLLLLCPSLTALSLPRPLGPGNRSDSLSEASRADTLRHAPAPSASGRGGAAQGARVATRPAVQRQPVGLEPDMQPADTFAWNNLHLEEVTVTARQPRTAETTTYTLDRLALDHTQMLNVGDITALLPGGRTSGDQSLISDGRIALRSQGSGEMGNPSFGTAIEVDGVRLANNATPGETLGPSTRRLSASDIEAVEVVTGIPSVEYGDLSNGIVRIKTRHGRTPWIVDLTTKPHTKLVAVSKGWGDWNFSLERARSVASLTSPYTTYTRNAARLGWQTMRFDRGERPLSLRAGVAGSVGGYHSEADPDAFRDTYTKVRDHEVRAYAGVEWQAGRPWLSQLEVQVAATYGDRRSRVNTNRSAAASQPQLHATERGYHIATDYDADPEAAIVLGPTGYWYELAVTDSRPLSAEGRLKAQWLHALGPVSSRLKVGADWSVAANEGRGLHYADMRYAPTWRPERYDTLPAMHNVALYGEEHLALAWADGRATASVTGGLRSDMTHVAGSAYGTVGSLAPRVSARLGWQAAPGVSAALYGGAGRAVKLPSFDMLFPSTAYVDQLAFAPGTMADGRTYYAYYTQPSRAAYNADLRWQYSTQAELGLELAARGTRLTLTAFRTTTRRPYVSLTTYEPYAYRFTGQAALEGSAIPSAQRAYSIDRETGVVSVSDRTGAQPDETPEGVERRLFRPQHTTANGSPSVRQGLEWTLDLARIRAIKTDIRIDGHWYRYRGVETTLVQSKPSDAQTASGGQPYPYVGYYDGAATGANGRLTRQVNANLTATTHIPAVKLLLTLRLEASLVQYRQALREAHGHATGIVVDAQGDYEGRGSLEADGAVAADDYRDHYVAIYPRYYATWDAPTELIPFERALADARDADPALWADLTRLIAKSNTTYFFNPDRVDPYLTAGVGVTKEIGRHVAITFTATNFWNNTRRVRSSQTGRETTLYGSQYIPSFYYGLSLKLKL